SAGPLALARLAGAAAFSGIGIATMHYIGMSALPASAPLQHDPRFVAASVAIAVGASGLALWLADRRRRRPPLLISAVAFGTAIARMHYTAMAGLAVLPHAAPMSGPPAPSTPPRALLVAIRALLTAARLPPPLAPAPSPRP